jgi:hypothetical protein
VGVGLYLRATPRIANPLEVVEHHLEARCQDALEYVSVGEGRLAAKLHPAAEEVEFARDGAFLTVEAKTSTAGPGYHAYLCDFLHALEPELGGTFGEVSDGDEPGAGDETGYFSTGDRVALEDEMLAWLRGVVSAVSEYISDGFNGLMISMSTDATFEVDGAIATPLGPRTADWLEATVQDPRAGIDIFPWWQPGLSAEHARGRALVRMWSDVRWREPLNDDETALLEEIDSDLQRARELDPALTLPWAEWSAILELLDRNDERARRVHERARDTPATIGYRRRPVRQSLTGGWSIRIPGEMASSFDEDGTWCGFMAGRTIWMSSFTLGDPEAPTRSAAGTLPDREHLGGLIELSPFPEGYAGRASLGTSEEGSTQLSVEVARPHRLALLTFVIDDDSDLAWAQEVAASVR